MLVKIILLPVFFVNVLCGGYDHEKGIPDVSDLLIPGAVINLGEACSSNKIGYVPGEYENYKYENDYYDEKYISRPCQKYDIYCIREYFAKNSQCKKEHGPVPDPYYRSQTNIYFSAINLTLTSLDVLYSGLNGRIEEFYVNKKTDNLVISIEFKDLTFYSQYSYYRIHRKGKEPIITTDYVYIKFDSVTTTTIIPNIKNLALEKSETHANLEAGVTYSFGENLFKSSDPSDKEAISNSQSALIATLPTSEQEHLLTDGPFFAATFIQYSLCDFGLKVV